jgi:hypothetical protein
MKDNPNTLTETSCRRFRISLTALLFAVPLLLLLTSSSEALAQSKRKTTSARKKLQAKTLADHIPPLITLTDGSLDIETPEFSDEEHNLPGNRPHKYKKSNVNHIERVRLWSITDDDSFSTKTPVLRPGWRVHIWLEQLQNGTYEPVASTPTTPCELPPLTTPSATPCEPQIVIKGSSLEIETDKDLKDPQQTHLPERPSKYEYQPYSAAHFRIARVEVCRGNCTGRNKIILPLRPDRTKVHIKILFWHPHDVRAKARTRR